MKRSFKSMAGPIAISKAIDYIEKDPDTRILNVINLVKKVDRGGQFKYGLDQLTKSMQDPQDNWNIYLHNLIRDIDLEVLKKFVINLMLNSAILTYPERVALAEKEDCNIPWAILFDPTSACNLKCTGCWAAEYGHKNSMSFEEMDDIITQGEELGIYAYIFSGGEPLMRKKDVIRLCEKHDECIFLSFTNGTLIDEAFAKEMRRVGNFTVAFSIEGWEKETDMRRGEGCYQKVIHAMDLLKAEKVPFGFSCCYHAFNTEVVTSDEFMDLMVEKGNKFAWYFTYMPVGKDADMSLLATPEQRKLACEAVRRFRATKPIFALDFWNDGEYVNGCIAGGKRYLHINAAGDVEPCAFIHYSNVNIHDVTLLEALKSPLFRQYRAHQPFNKNQMRPCPCLDNQGVLAEMVHASGAHSTDMMAPESVDELSAKTKIAADKWEPVAKEIWENNPKSKLDKFK